MIGDSDRWRELVERCGDGEPWEGVDAEFVVTSSEGRRCIGCQQTAALVGASGGQISDCFCELVERGCDGETGEGVVWVPETPSCLVMQRCGIRGSVRRIAVIVVLQSRHRSAPSGSRRADTASVDRVTGAVGVRCSGQ